MSLKSSDLELMKKMIPIVKGMKRSTWYNEILPASIKSIEEFIFEIERIYNGKHKISISQKEELINFIKELENNHKNENENMKRKVRYNVFKMLADFVGR
jgi:hypothetical protein